MDDITRRLQWLEARTFANTLVLASLLKRMPDVIQELETFADHLEDAPPVAVSDDLLESMSSHIRAVLRGRWKD